MKKPTTEQITAWTQMTDNNEHGLVREEIATWFQTQKEYDQHCRIRDYVSSFRYINAAHDKDGCLDFDLYGIRNILTHAMIEDIGKIDHSAAELINGCL